MEAFILSIAKEFCLKGTPFKIEELSSGNINFTCKITCADEKNAEAVYILQKVNTTVFKDPSALMNNIQKVSEHITKKVDSEYELSKRRSLRYIPTKGGKLLYTDEQQNYWRCCLFVANATAYDAITSDKLFYEAGRGFGRFQRFLADFPIDSLSETIPDFHNTQARYEVFLKDIQRDVVGRVESVKAEISEIFKRESSMNSITKQLEAGALPLRVTHNDTKLNNVMIDNDTGKALCVIDLDTVMPGSVLYDFGDAIRHGASSAAEDEEDTLKIALDMRLFQIFTDGFLKECGCILTEAEIRLLPLGVKVMTLELAMRFLQDYINGDVYFKTSKADHNLLRARAQLALLSDIEKKYEQMCDYVLRVLPIFSASATL